MINPKKCFRLLAAILICGAVTVLGQTPPVPVAPKPAQLVTARSVFIANDSFVGGTGSDNMYDHYYFAIQKLNRFSIVLAPQEADLILEFSIIHNAGINQPGHTHNMRVLDAKTHFVLWSVSENEDGAARQVNVEKNFQDALGRLAADLQRVTSPTK